MSARVNGRISDRGVAYFSRNLWTASLVLVLVGSVVSGYLSYVKFADKETVCLENETFDCDLVNNSRYAEMAGIPIAYLGLMAYLVIGVLLLVENRAGFLRENGVFLVFGLVLCAFVYSLYLVYLQGFILKVWCQWCLAHEAAMTLLFVVTGFRVKRVIAVGTE